MVAATVGAAGETRQVFQGLGVLAKAGFYVLALAATVSFVAGCWYRVAKYRQGRRRATGRREPLARSLAAIGANTTVRKRDKAAGIAHFFVYWGFITMFLGTVTLTLDYDIVRNATRLVGGHEDTFFDGTFYLGYSLVLDVMGLGAVLGMLYLGWRRAFRRQAALDYTRAEQPPEGYSRSAYGRGDWLFWGLLVAILVTGFVHKGLRIRAAGFPAFEHWSPVGWVLAKGVSGLGVGPATAGDLRLDIWWVHILLSLAFIAYIPWSKAMHMFTDTANLVAHDPRSHLELAAPIAGVDHVGYRSVSDFTWKELLDLDSCTKCGRCHVVCPAVASGAPLSPRDVILDLRQWVDHRSGGRTLLDSESRSACTGPLSPDTDSRLAGDVVTAEVLWSCTTCGACVEACPVGIEHVSTIVQLRRSLVDDGSLEPSLQTALQNIAQQGNSFGKSGRMRARWTKELAVPIKDARSEPVRFLWFVGDFASFDERIQRISRTLAGILRESEVDFGLLYEDEWNAGNDVRRVGEEGLFEMLVEHNMAAFSTAQFETIFTTDPHSFNTLRNEYPRYGLDRPVIHYTELLADLLEAGAIPVRPLGTRVTYHDPCYLARYNRQTDAPRRVLSALGCEVVEMPRNRENTFCCGAGGGRIWMDDSGLRERPSENRIREAASLDVEWFVVACPKDFTMYSDAAKTAGQDGRLRVVDLVELVEEAAIRAPFATVD